MPSCRRISTGWCSPGRIDQRPTKWVIDLARQRLADLQNIVKTRLAAADPSLSEALELMSFRTNPVGSQHVERFVPIAEPERERQLEAGREEREVDRRDLDVDRDQAGALRQRPRPRPTSKAAKTASDGKVPAKPPIYTTITAVVKDAARLLKLGPRMA